MTLRDWLAGQALTGLLAGNYRHSSQHNLSEVPSEAFRIADAMLVARDDIVEPESPPPAPTVTGALYDTRDPECSSCKPADGPKACPGCWIPF